MFSLKAIVLVVAILYLAQVNSIPVYDDLEGASSDHGKSPNYKMI